MEITYLGHSAFKLKGKEGTVVTDPYSAYVGFELPGTSADIVTVSHHHPDHDAFAQVKGTARRDKPFIIDQAGEYEVGGISVFGIKTFHDGTMGTERGSNIIFTIMVDEVRVCHLGDLGHPLSQQQLADIGEVDVVLCPVGGHFTIDAATAVKTMNILEPAYAVPMHFRTPEHNMDVFSDLATMDDFVKEYGMMPKALPKLSIEKDRLPEETELVILSRS